MYRWRPSQGWESPKELGAGAARAVPGLPAASRGPGGRWKDSGYCSELCGSWSWKGRGWYLCLQDFLWLQCGDLTSGQGQEGAVRGTGVGVEGK